jgi:hypothetical protein
MEESQVIWPYHFHRKFFLKSNLATSGIPRVNLAHFIIKFFLSAISGSIPGLLMHLIEHFKGSEIINFHYRGKDFRPDYLKVSRLRAIYSKLPILAMTATITEALLHETLVSLNMEEEDFLFVNRLPDRQKYSYFT